MTSMSTSPVYTVSRARACTPYMSKLDMVDMVPLFAAPASLTSPTGSTP